MSSEPPLDSDAIPGEFRETALLETTARAHRVGADLLNKSRSDRNYNAPAPEYDPKTNTRFYTAAPTPLKRQFSSPLAQKGINAKGPNGERLVTSGWGDARSVNYGGDSDSNRRHGGIDFRAPVGEDALACGDGTVTFVGFQRRLGLSRVSVVHPSVPDPNQAGYVVDGSGTVVAQKTDLGHGGVYVEITHSGDFHGYMTQYMHLSDTAVRLNQKVTESDVIGKVGRSGGVNGITTGPHLHWQVRFHGTLVKPEALVPLYFPGHTLDTEQATTIPATNIAATIRSVAEQVVHGRVLGALQTVARAITMENQSRASRDVIRGQQATSAESAAKSMTMHASSLYEAIAKFQGALPVVSNAMAFDFDTGLWTDNGKPV